MKTINIPDEIFERLQAHAEPFVDTPVTVISKLLDSYDNRSLAASSFVESQGSRKFDGGAPPNLKHTKLVFAKVGKTVINRPKWNELSRKVHQIAYEKLDGFDDLNAMSTARIVEGDKSNEGYKPVPGYDFSMQGMASGESWETSRDLAKKIGVPVIVEFIWRDKDGAAFPGLKGMMEG